MSSHIIGGEFQSDKYPTCPRGKVPLSVKDPTAQDLLWQYAQRRRSVDAEFSEDLETALRAAGYEPQTDSTRGIYRYAEDFGRMGHLTGVFIADHTEVEAAMGKDACLGEVLGKHSDVTAEISEETVKLVTADPAMVEMFATLGLSTGMNPIATLEDE